MSEEKTSEIGKGKKEEAGINAHFILGRNREEDEAMAIIREKAEKYNIDAAAAANLIARFYLQTRQEKTEERTTSESEPNS